METSEPGVLPRKFQSHTGWQGCCQSPAVRGGAGLLLQPKTLRGRLGMVTGLGDPDIHQAWGIHRGQSQIGAMEKKGWVVGWGGNEAQCGEEASLLPRRGGKPERKH